MKVVIELNKEIVELLDRYRVERVSYHRESGNIAPDKNVKDYHRNQIRFYAKVSYEYLVNEYLFHQAYFEDKKTD